jgi:hypothetical protein
MWCRLSDLKALQLCSFGRVVCEIQVNFRCSEIAHWYNTWLGSYNSSDGRFESTAVMINVVFFYLFVCLVFC